MASVVLLLRGFGEWGRGWQPHCLCVKLFVFFETKKGIKNVMKLFVKNQIPVFHHNVDVTLF